jgi:hypothetical protein
MQIKIAEMRFVRDRNSLRQAKHQHAQEQVERDS